MLYTNKMLLERYKDYSNPADKIRRDLLNNLIFRINRGLYEDDPNANKFVLANMIYGPSYISFESALSYYGMIPEAVYSTTCATFEKRRNKFFNNKYGKFWYRDIPSEVYPYGIEVINKDDDSFYIASKEKALCDMLYMSQTVKDINQLKYLIFEDLRIDEEIYSSLDKDDLIFLAKKYPGINLRLFVKMLEGEK